jgi:hypothetical protein
VGNASLAHETQQPNHLIPSFPDKPIVRTHVVEVVLSRLHIHARYTIDPAQLCALSLFATSIDPSVLLPVSGLACLIVVLLFFR